MTIETFDSENIFPITGWHVSKLIRDWHGPLLFLADVWVHFLSSTVVCTYISGTYWHSLDPRALVVSTVQTAKDPSLFTGLLFFSAIIVPLIYGSRKIVRFLRHKHYTTASAPAIALLLLQLPYFDNDVGRTFVLCLGSITTIFRFVSAFTSDQDDGRRQRYPAASLLGLLLLGLVRWCWHSVNPLHYRYRSSLVLVAILGVGAAAVRYVVHEERRDRLRHPPHSRDVFDVLLLPHSSDDHDDSHSDSSSSGHDHSHIARWAWLGWALCGPVLGLLVFLTMWIANDPAVIPRWVGVDPLWGGLLLAAFALGLTWSLSRDPPGAKIFTLISTLAFLLITQDGFIGLAGGVLLAVATPLLWMRIWRDRSVFALASLHMGRTLMLAGLVFSLGFLSSLGSVVGLYVPPPFAYFQGRFNLLLAITLAPIILCANLASWADRAIIGVDSSGYVRDQVASEPTTTTTTTSDTHASSDDTQTLRRRGHASEKDKPAAPEAAAEAEAEEDEPKGKSRSNSLLERYHTVAEIDQWRRKQARVRAKEVRTALLFLLIVIGLPVTLFRLGSDRVVESDATQDDLVVMSFNVQQGYTVDGTLNVPGVRDLVESQGVNILGLQESDSVHLCSGNIDLVGYLSSRLHMYEHYGLPTRVGSVGCALLTRFPMTDTHGKSTMITHSLPTVQTHERGCLQRQIVEGRFSYREQEVTVLVTHLEYACAEDRKLQVTMLAEMIRNSTGPLIVMGDFNLQPHTPEMAAIFATGVKDALAEMDAAHDTEDVVGEGRIDYIFYRGLNLRSARVINYRGPRLSDHKPLVARFDL